jgi:hypothetical protein
MDHDGHHGTLHITSTDPFVATYTPDGGAAIPVHGTFPESTPHALHAAIPFDAAHPQPFKLYIHTREKDLFSGTTVWGGATFGVHGRLFTIAEVGGFERLEFDSELVEEVLVAQGRRTFMVGGGLCPSREFDYREFSRRLRLMFTAVNFLPGADLTWSLGGVHVPPGTDVPLVVPTSPLSPEIVEPDGTETIPVRSARVLVTSSGTTLSFVNDPADRGYWLDIEARSETGRRASMTLGPSERRFEVPGLMEASDHCFIEFYDSLRTETPVKVVPLIDPPYPDETIDPRLDVVLKTTPPEERTAALRHLAVVRSIVAAAPKDATAVADAVAQMARAAERMHGLPRGTAGSG